MDLADAVAQDVGEAQEDGQLDAAGLQLVDHFLEIDGLVGPLVRMDGDVTRLVDSEISLPPVADAVHLDGVLNLPFVHQFRFSAFRHLVDLH